MENPPTSWNAIREAQTKISDSNGSPSPSRTFQHSSSKRARLGLSVPTPKALRKQQLCSLLAFGGALARAATRVRSKIPNPVKMSRAYDGHRLFFHVGNPFRSLLPRGSHLSPKLRCLLASYEEAMVSSLRRLKTENISDVLTLSWMTLAIDCLSELHNDIGTLITELALPVSDWDEKWVDIYLNSSVMLLDICIALSSELARLDQGQLLLQYVVHVLDSTSVPSLEQLKQAEVALQDWTARVGTKCSRLENCSTILQDLAGSLSLTKVKNSAKGKVLMQALYGIKAMTIFICSMLVAILLGSSKPLIELRVPEKLIWSQAFNDLQAAVNSELRRHFSSGSVATIKELEAVESCATRLHVLTITAQCEEASAKQACDISHEKEVIMSENVTHQEGAREDSVKQAHGISHENEVTMLERDPEAGRQEDNVKQANGTCHEKEVSILEKSNGQEGRPELLECISNMSRSAEALRLGLDSLSKRVGEFFQIVLTGRDALLCNLRISDVSVVKAAEVRS